MNSDITTARFSDVSLRQASIITGVGLLIITVLAPFGHISINNLIVPGDAAATASKITASEGLFRISICCLLINAVLDMVAAWGLYIILRPVNKSLSLLSAWFRIAYSAILVVALSHYFNVFQLLSGADYLAAFEPNQLHAQVMQFIHAHDYVWDLGFVVFGFHLLVLGYLLFKSGNLPRILGILVVIAGLGYLVDSFGLILFPNYSLTISVYTFWGEVLLWILLLWRGSKGFDRKSEDGVPRPTHGL